MVIFHSELLVYQRLLVLSYHNPFSTLEMHPKELPVKGPSRGKLSIFHWGKKTDPAGFQEGPKISYAIVSQKLKTSLIGMSNDKCFIFQQPDEYLSESISRCVP
jgi:hypothetical protein